MTDARVWIHRDGQAHAAEPTSPAGWSGQTDCVIGPFSNEAAAHNFGATELRQAPASRRYFVSGNAWYLELTPVES